MGHMHAGTENQYHIPVDQYQNIAILYILNQKCIIILLSRKASVGMYNGCDTLSLQILVYVFFGTAIPTSSFNFIQLFFILVVRYCRVK